VVAEETTENLMFWLKNLLEMSAMKLHPKSTPERETKTYMSQMMQLQT
jgi:hypothetical protein